MAIVSTERVVVFTVTPEGREKPVLTVGLAELELARVRVVGEGEASTVVVELVSRTASGGGSPAGSPLVQRPQVRCEGEVVAAAVCSTVNWAKAQHEEARCRVGPED